MCEGNKKISFGFTKFSKSMKKVEVKKSVEYIDCLEGKSIKIKGDATPTETQELIIPVKTNTVSVSTSKKEEKDEKQTLGGSVTSETNTNKEFKDSLEERAIQEILQETKEVKKNESNIFILAPGNDKVPLQNEPTSSDYENVPVAEFGKAMLRGMGWNPEKGIGKNERVVAPQDVILRPKGMGLGAEKRIVTQQNSDEAEELVLVKGCYIQVIHGTHRNVYGQVEGFDDDVGRVLIKTALGSARISVSESMIKVITTEEYKKYSRVLNLTKFEEIKKKEENGYEYTRLNGSKIRSDFYNMNGREEPSQSKRHRK